MNALNLDAIRKRAEAVTSAPWKVFPYLVTGTFEVGVGDFDVRIASDIDSKADAEFIAAARRDVPALLAEVERLRTDKAKLISELQKADRMYDDLKRKCDVDSIGKLRKEIDGFLESKRKEWSE